ncbi:hypothetical protein T11_10475 [Trichinella zimbabwensis]|uniref:Uncharacterized protein n=1 Tax=Trichinella zimbabwensis TaxID=268475 RepID=A0A0V1GEM7_9BILA|nr:hypothetical protein T11_10475 [Trichinella zimbabwensis]
MLNVKSKIFSLYHIAKLINRTKNFVIELLNALNELRERFTTLPLAT